MKALTTILLTLSTIVSCSEDNGANLLVTSMHNGKTVGQSMVYLTEGHNIDPQLALIDYSFSQRSDGTGQAHFKGLDEGDYTIYVYGYFEYQKVQGRQELVVSSAGRMKTSKIVVNLN